MAVLRPPNVEQVPAGQMQTTTSWNFTEPMPKADGKPGS
jgi:hypothetical protein